MKKSKKKSSNFIAENRRARFDFELLKQYEAGLSLQGWEVRSLRLGKAQIAEAYVLLKDSEAWLLGSYIVPLNNDSGDQLATRTRKLLLNKKELAEIFKATQQKGEACVPLNLFWKDNLVKCQISTAKGKKSQDKRQTIKSRDWERQKARELRTRSK